VRLALLWLAVAMCSALAQDPGAARTYLVKLSVAVSTRESKAGDKIRAAIISPESLLNGYLQGSVAESASQRLLLRFDSVLYKGRSTPISGTLVGFVNSKGHKDVDDDEQPVKLEGGAFVSAGSGLWLDEGAELKVRAVPPAQRR
jgi:hypothetical protein